MHLTLPKRILGRCASLVLPRSTIRHLESIRLIVPTQFGLWDDSSSDGTGGPLCYSPTQRGSVSIERPCATVFSQILPTDFFVAAKVLRIQQTCWPPAETARANCPRRVKCIAQFGIWSLKFPGPVTHHARIAASGLWPSASGPMPSAVSLKLQATSCRKEYRVQNTECGLRNAECQNTTHGNLRNLRNLRMKVSGGL